MKAGDMFPAMRITSCRGCRQFLHCCGCCLCFHQPSFLCDGWLTARLARDREREIHIQTISLTYTPKLWLLSDIFIYFHGILGHFCCHHLTPPDLCQVRRASLQVLGQLQVKSKALVRRPIAQGDAAMGCGANVGVLVLVGWSGVGFFVLFSVLFAFVCFIWSVE